MAADFSSLCQLVDRPNIQVQVLGNGAGRNVWFAAGICAHDISEVNGHSVTPMQPVLQLAFLYLRLAMQTCVEQFLLAQDIFSP